MQTTVQKWGNSQGIRLPKAFLDAVGISENDRVNIKRADNTIVIEKAEEKNTLDEIFAGYDGTSPEVYDWGEPMGREVW